MIISEKQIMRLISFSHGYLDLLNLIVHTGAGIYSPDEIRQEITNLINQIVDQQPHQLKMIE